MSVSSKNTQIHRSLQVGKRRLAVHDRCRHEHAAAKGVKRLRLPWKKDAIQEQAEEPLGTEPLSANNRMPAEPLVAFEVTGSKQAENTPANRAKHPLIENLTPREHDVFDLLIQGLKLQEIADALGVKYSTVNTHQKSTYKKLGVNSRAECIIRYGNLGKER